jgi:hypothetical protein
MESYHWIDRPLGEAYPFIDFSLVISDSSISESVFIVVPGKHGHILPHLLH